MCIRDSHTSYPEDVKITQLRNEHQQKDGEIITDSCLLIGKKMYHKMCIRDSSVSIEDQVSGECKEDGAYCKNVCGTYVHGVFDREDVAEAVVRCLLYTSRCV